MPLNDKAILELFSSLWAGLSISNKEAIVEKLTELLNQEKMKRKKALQDSFGSWTSEESQEEISTENEGEKKAAANESPFGEYIPEKTAEEIIADLKSARKFRNRDIKF